jgi:phosphoribosylanthranilate isomerase
MTKVKICGITNLEDALLSVKLGADALGFNFYPKSPRYITPEDAREIIEQLPSDVLKVGVFVNEEIQKIIEIIEKAKLDAVQLHGDEQCEFVTSLKGSTRAEIIKAVRVTPEFRWEDVLDFDADAILLDSFSKDQYGGSGKRFDWQIAQQVWTMIGCLYLAGGISIESVREAIQKVRPYAVDVCSSVESSPGKKDHELLRRFIAEAKRND